MSETAKCSVDGCDRPFLARGMCRRHYSRWYRHGTTADPAVIPGECVKWLRAHVGFAGDGCLTWPYARLKTGYGVVFFDGRMQMAGRAMCTLMHGPAPSETHEAAHTCGKGHEGCVHPGHLYWATPKQNQADRRAHGTYMCGERAPWAKLTEAQALEVLQLAGTMRHKDIAAMFGITRAAVGAIASRRNWAHLGDAPHG